MAGPYPPVRPVNLSASLDSGALRVSWEPGTDPFGADSSEPESFVVKVSLNGETFRGVAQIPAGESSASVPVSGHGTARVKVSARNSNGESIDSDIVTVAY